MLPLLLVCSWLSASVLPLTPPPNRYHVRISDDATTAHVTAHLEVRSNILALYNVTPVSDLPNGQADLLADLSVRDEEGTTVPHRDLGEGDFEIERGGPLEVTYTVRLEHDRYPWPFGKEEVAYRTSEGLMATGYALFLADTADTLSGPIEVTFELPAGWQAHTPWTRTAGATTFYVPTRRDLLSNAVFLGTAYSEAIELGGFTLTLVLGKPYVESRDLFVDLLRPQLASYIDLFGGPPLADRFLIVINQDDRSDGGAFSGSFSQVIQGEATVESRVIWGHGMAHELLHFWNGLTLVPADSREEWFKEGVTDYLTVTTLARNGLVERELLFKRLENFLRRFVLARFMQGLQMTLREAGEHKAANRQLIYGGGALAALALDVELRRRTDDGAGLPDLMRALYAAHGRPDAPYTLSDIERIAEELTRSDLRDFFASNVESEGLLDTGSSFDALGLRVDQFLDEVFVGFEPAATPGERARFEAVFGISGR